MADDKIVTGGRQQGKTLIHEFLRQQPLYAALPQHSIVTMTDMGNAHQRGGPTIAELLGAGVSMLRVARIIGLLDSSDRRKRKRGNRLARIILNERK